MRWNGSRGMAWGDVEGDPGSGVGRVGLTMLLASLAMGAGADLSAQTPEFNFFVVAEGPTWGADSPALEVSDQHCSDLAYNAGFGDGEWRAYLDGSASGEAGEVGRERIGSGPWWNYYGTVIAEDLAELHSDANNLNGETAITIEGEYAPDGVLEVPPGSELTGSLFSREGPFLCFKLPG